MAWKGVVQCRSTQGCALGFHTAALQACDQVP